MGSALFHPQRVQALGIYNKLWFFGEYRDQDTDDKGYKRDRATKIEGEKKITKQFSLNLSLGYHDHYAPSEKSWSAWDRTTLGSKWAYENRSWIFGAGLHLSSYDFAAAKTDDPNRRFFMIRFHFGIGYKFGNVSLQSILSYQSESNRKFREASNEQFRRDIEGGVALSYRLNHVIGFQLESLYRIPENKKDPIDPEFWNLYPGITFSTLSGVLGVSFLKSMKSGDSIDRGIRLSYFHFFE